MNRTSDERALVQAVRLADVFALGPAMVYVAYKARGVPAPLRWFLGLSGVATILWNGDRYLRTAAGEEVPG